jgi:hypothetical protein
MYDHQKIIFKKLTSVVLESTSKLLQFYNECTNIFSKFLRFWLVFCQILANTERTALIDNLINKSNSSITTLFNATFSFCLLQPDFFRSGGLSSDPRHSFCGPDVTLATTAAMSSLNLHHGSDPDSPDLVSVDGSNVSYTGGGNRYLKNTRQKRHIRTEQVNIFFFFLFSHLISKSQFSLKKNYSILIIM